MIRLGPVAVVAAVMLAGTGGGFSEKPPAPPIDRGTVAEQLADAHGCWTGEAPARYAGKVPGHAIVTRDGLTVRTTDVGAALDDVFTADNPRLTVHAFCP